MVENALSCQELQPDIVAAVRGKHVVIDNAAYDSRFPPGLEKGRRLCFLPYVAVQRL